MKIYSFQKEQRVPKSLEEVFAFFSRPENLAVLTPGSIGFVILTKSPLEMKPGLEIDYTIRLFGFRVRWKTLITEYDPPHRFVDVQVQGPYRLWEHTHRFHPDPQGGVRVIDEVRYAMPFGWIGRLLRRIHVAAELERIFHYRERKIREIFK